MNNPAKGGQNPMSTWAVKPFARMILLLFLAVGASACSALPGGAPAAPALTTATPFVWPTVAPSVTLKPPTPEPTLPPAPMLPTLSAAEAATATRVAAVPATAPAPARTSVRTIPEICTATSAKPGKTLIGASGGQTMVLFHPAGRYFATFVPAAGAGTVSLWNLPGEKLRTRTGNYGVIALSPDGRVLGLGGADKMITVWVVDTWTEERRMTGYREAITAVAFSPDARSILAGDAAGNLRLWNLATGSLVREFKTGGVTIRALAFSPNGQTFVSGGPNAPTILWEVATGAQLKQADRKSSYALGFSPDGSQIAGGNDGSLVSVWDTNLKEIKKFDLGNGAVVTAVSFSPDGRWLAAGGGASNPAGKPTLRVWEVSTSRERFSLGYAAELTSAAFSPDCKLLAAGDVTGAVRFWDLK